MLLSASQDIYCIIYPDMRYIVHFSWTVPPPPPTPQKKQKKKIKNVTQKKKKKI
jgi:hypothetical protein